MGRGVRLGCMKNCVTLTLTLTRTLKQCCRSSVYRVEVGSDCGYEVLWGACDCDQNRNWNRFCICFVTVAPTLTPAITLIPIVCCDSRDLERLPGAAAKLCRQAMQPDTPSTSSIQLVRDREAASSMPAVPVIGLDLILRHYTRDDL